MRFARCLFLVTATLAPIDASLARDPAEPPAEITPDTIRVQPTDPDGTGHWITLAGYRELGSPCFSRDGGWVAFDAYKAGYDNSRPECWVAKRDGTGLRKLADGATPRWSPRGDRLLFIRGSEGDRGSDPDVYVIDADGGGERKLGPGRWPDWSPDGKRLAFSRGGLAGGGVKVGAKVYVADRDGGGAAEVADGDCPSWSPDGKRLAVCFRPEGEPPMILSVDVETKRIRELGIGWFRANWTPDGVWVQANGPDRFDGTGMVRLAADGSRRSGLLFSQFEDASSPCPSADGESMAFVARRPRKRP